MSEGHRRGEFFGCGWKLSLCDWTTSRLSVCSLSLAVCVCVAVWVLEDAKGTQVCTTSFLQEKLTLPVLPPPLPFRKNKSTLNMTTDVFAAESSLAVGVELSALCNPPWRCLTSSLPRPWVLRRDATNLQCLAHLQLRPSRAFNHSSDHFRSLLKDLKIYIAHTHTPKAQVQIRVAHCGWTCAVLPQAQGSASMQGPDSQRGPLCYYRALGTGDWMDPGQWASGQAYNAITLLPYWITPSATFLAVLPESIDSTGTGRKGQTEVLYRGSPRHVL